MRRVDHSSPTHRVTPVRFDRVNKSLNQDASWEDWFHYFFKLSTEKKKKTLQISKRFLLILLQLHISQLAGLTFDL